jgi:hypothetical protein
MAITKEQWQQVEQELAQSVCHVTFKIDDEEVSVSRRLVSESKLELYVYINGYVKGEWYSYKDDAELTRPKCFKAVNRKRTRSLYSPKEKAQVIKAIGKRAAAKHYPRLNDKLEFYTPNFATAKSLVAQFKKIPNIELVVKES